MYGYHYQAASVIITAWLLLMLLLQPPSAKGIIDRANQNYFRLRYLYNIVHDMKMDQKQPLDSTKASDQELLFLHDKLEMLVGTGSGGYRGGALFVGRGGNQCRLIPC
jgi:hypothetical protein